MAALCPGVQYGLSSQENFGENKDLVFVKLTDSAYRAIEEYLRIQKQNKHLSRTPTIKFLGNEGQLCFPTSPAPLAASSGPLPAPSSSTATFNFSLSSTADMEGPGGSFECVRHRLLSTVGGGGPRGGGATLAGLGPITHKMRVHATDDVYEETRKRMTFADKVHKNKCTREIKMNQTDIGRKVKVKQHHNPTQSSSTSQSAAAPSASRSGNIGSGGGGSSSIGSNSNGNVRRSDQQLSSFNSGVTSMGFTSAAAAITSSSSTPNINTVANANANQSPLKTSSPYSPSLNSNNNMNNSSLNNHSLYNNGNNGLVDRIGGGGVGGMQQRPQSGQQQQGLRSNHVSSSRTSKPSLSSIARRPLRERLIHLLALRPFKKIELHERLNKEGMRERNAISSVLKQVSTLKDNCFYLNRVMWNDVQEDWPFYSEQEKQMLKRRKPQNLTPPGGSDGGSSTGSGNSPTSTHPGSPPSTTTTTMSSGRHRVAHHSASIQQQPPSVLSTVHQGGGGYNRQQQQQLVDGNRSRQLPPVDRRDASGTNPRSRQSQQPQPQLQQGYGWSYGAGMKRQLSDDEEERVGEDNRGGSDRKRKCDNSHTLSFGVSRETVANQWEPTSSPSKPPTQQQHRQQQPPPSSFDSLRNARPYNPQHSGSNKQVNNNANWWHKRENDVVHLQEQHRRPASSKEVVRVSPDSQSDRIESMDCEEEEQQQQQQQQQPKTAEAPDDVEDDYVREYTTIGDLEQRRRYKSDFNAVYDEYKDLHGTVESVSRRFQLLDERLKKESTANTAKYNEIKEQIMREYKLTKKDQRHQLAKRRFEYLHRKLSHIKSLVSQYDQQIQDETQRQVSY